MEHGLVVVEVALAMLIVAGAAMLGRSVSRLYAIDPGIETSNIAVSVVLAPADVGPVARQQAITEITDAIAALLKKQGETVYRIGTLGERDRQPVMMHE